MDQQWIAIDALRVLANAESLDSESEGHQLADLIAFPLLITSFGACSGALPDDMRLALADVWDDRAAAIPTYRRAIP